MADTKTSRQNHPDSRRKLLQAGLAAAPLVATIASRPAWAVTDKCSISGNMSGNVSNADTEIEICREDIPLGEGLSPGYWHKWTYVYEFILAHPTWSPSLTGIQGPFKSNNFNNLGEGNALTILYNWSLAAVNVSLSALGGLGLSTFHPTVPAGSVDRNASEVGLALATPFPNAPIANLYAAILSTALPGSRFPLPGAPRWTDEYIVRNYNDAATRDDLLTVISAFFDGNHPTPALTPFFTTDPEEAYRWARNYLFNIPKADP